VGIEKDYSLEDIRAVSTEKLYDIMASCGSPGYYQMAVEELQRRFLQNIASQTLSLTESGQRVEAVTNKLEGTVTTVGASIQNLVRSSERLERLTKSIIWLTIALLLLTVIQVVLIVRDQFLPKSVPQIQPVVQQTKPSPPKTPN
jgi:hypothetical protein